MPISPPTTTPTHASRLPILLIGAGLTGLTLAQSLTTSNIPFRIFERDPDPLHRGTGWAITIHWALDAFLSLLPDEVAARLPECYVNGEAMRRGKKGRFLFFDVRSGKARWSVPMGEGGRARVGRERLRGVLGDGMPVEYAKTLATITTTAESVTAHFKDGTSATGCMIVGCDGSRSRVRQFLCPSTYENCPLPVRFLGVTVVLTAAQASAMRTLDPYFLQGGDPETDAYLWFSFLDTPTNNARGTDTYMVQLMISWPYRPGFLQDPLPTETPNTAPERLAFMKRIAQDWAEPFRSVVLGIPNSTEPKNIRLEDWLPEMWDNRGERVTLVGDAAHAMVMFRGDAANHGFMDIKILIDHLLPVLRESGVDTQTDLAAAVNTYEAEMRTRCTPAVLASRQACLDANEYRRIDEKSPLVAKRVMNSE